jgi:hypothetical protein
MTTLRFLVHHPVKVKRIKLAAESTCEICGRAGGQEALEVHSLLESGENRYSLADLERFLLVLCQNCHREVHFLLVPAEEQEMLVRQRTEDVREKIRTILRYNPKPYTPPDVDMEDAYREASAPHVRY